MKMLKILLLAIVFILPVNCFSEDYDPAIGDQILQNYNLKSQKILKTLLNRPEKLGIELLVGGPSVGRPEGALGHLAIRIVDHDLQSPLMDPVFEVNGIYTSQTAQIWPGLTGKYPLALKSGSYLEFLTRYQTGVARVVERIIIPTNPEIRKKILSELFRFATIGPRKEGYRFHSNNCMTVIMDILQEAGLDVDRIGKLDGAIPIRAKIFTNRSLVSPYPTINTASNQESFYFIKNNLKERYKVSIDFASFEQLKEVTANLSAGQLYSLYTSDELNPWPNLVSAVSFNLKQLKAKSPEDLEASKISNSEHLPEPFYNSDFECGSHSEIRSNLEKFWTTKEIHRYTSRQKSKLEEFRLQQRRDASYSRTNLVPSSSIIDCLAELYLQ